MSCLCSAFFSILLKTICAKTQCVGSATTTTIVVRVTQSSSPVKSLLCLVSSFTCQQIRENNEKRQGTLATGFFSPRRVPKDFAHKNSKIDNFTLESCVASESCPPVNVGHYIESKAGQVTCNYCCRLVVCVKTTTTFHVVVLSIPRTFSCVVASTAPTIRRSRLSVISCL